MSADRIDVLAVMDRAAHFSRAGKAIDVHSLREARAAVAELIALMGAMVEADRLVGREDIGELFWPEFVVEMKKCLARVKP